MNFLLPVLCKGSLAFATLAARTFGCLPYDESWDVDLPCMARMGNVVRKVHHVLNKILPAVAAGRVQANRREVSAVW